MPKPLKNNAPSLGFVNYNGSIVLFNICVLFIALFAIYNDVTAPSLIYNDVTAPSLIYAYVIAFDAI